MAHPPPPQGGPAGLPRCHAISGAVGPSWRAHAEIAVTHGLVQISVWSLRVVGIVWLGTAIWFAARRPGTFRGKVAHFFRTLLPEPWLLLCLVVLILGLYLMPAWIWSPLLVRAPVLGSSAPCSPSSRRR